MRCVLSHRAQHPSPPKVHVRLLEQVRDHVPRHGRLRQLPDLHHRIHPARRRHRRNRLRVRCVLFVKCALVLGAVVSGIRAWGSGAECVCVPFVSRLCFSHEKRVLFVLQPRILYLRKGTRTRTWTHTRTASSHASADSSSTPTRFVTHRYSYVQGPFLAAAPVENTTVVTLL